MPSPRGNSSPSAPVPAEWGAANSGFERDSREIEIDCSTCSVRREMEREIEREREGRSAGRDGAPLDSASKSRGWRNGGGGRDKPK
jgi:hypothetical protein